MILGGEALKIGTQVYYRSCMGKKSEKLWKGPTKECSVYYPRAV